MSVEGASFALACSGLLADTMVACQPLPSAHVTLMATVHVDGSPVFAALGQLHVRRAAVSVKLALVSMPALAKVAPSVAS